MAVGTHSTTVEPPAIPDTPVCRLSVDQYLQMVRAGILDEEDQVELLEGWIVPKMTKGPEHLDAVYKLIAALTSLLPPGWHLNKEDPLETTDGLPEPDLVVMRGERPSKIVKLPQARDAALVIEVADTSLDRDRAAKARTYGRAGIPVYWIVNLPDRRFEIYSSPTGAPGETTYPASRVVGFDEHVPVVLDGVEIGRIAVRDILS